MEKFINKLRHDYPMVRFCQGEAARWSAETQTVSYTTGGQEAAWSVLHELGHGLLGHSAYESDVGLLQKETMAWDKAREIAKKYNVRIATDYVEDCLDTYRDWLHKRSTCPRCGVHGLQQSRMLYQCFNCQTTWKVSRHRFCRPYRFKVASI